MTNRRTKTSLLLLMALAILAGLAIWRFGWHWTGLTPYETVTKTDNGSIVTETHPGKTLWDFLELIIVPTALAVGAYLFSKAQSDNEQIMALNQQQETLLQNYIDAMTGLILEKHLRDTWEERAQDIDLRMVARARTLTVLRALDAPNKDGKNRRKGSLIRFLYETQLISGANPIISLKNANIEGAYMRKFDLRNANLQGSYLIKADLRDANLEGACMEKADLRGANLTGANLNNADLKESIYGLYEDTSTKWPEDFDLTSTAAIKRDHH